MNAGYFKRMHTSVLPLKDDSNFIPHMLYTNVQ